MGSITTSLVIMSGITLLLYFGGFLSGTPSTTLLDLALNPDNLETSALGVIFASIGATVLAVAAALFARQQGSDFYLMIPLVELLFLFGWDFIATYEVLSSISEIAGAVAVLIYGPFMIYYIVSVFEWWRGVST